MGPGKPGGLISPTMQEERNFSPQMAVPRSIGLHWQFHIGVTFPFSLSSTIAGGAQLHPADGEEDPGQRRQRAAHPKVHPARCSHRPLPALPGAFGRGRQLLWCIRFQITRRWWTSSSWRAQRLLPALPGRFAARDTTHSAGSRSARSVPIVPFATFCRRPRPRSWW